MRTLTRSALVKGALVDWMMVAVRLVVNRRQWIWQEFNSILVYNAPVENSEKFLTYIRNRLYYYLVSKLGKR